MQVFFYHHEESFLLGSGSFTRYGSGKTPSMSRTVRCEGGSRLRNRTAPADTRPRPPSAGTDPDTPYRTPGKGISGPTNTALRFPGYTAAGRVWIVPPAEETADRYPPGAGSL